MSQSISFEPDQDEDEFRLIVDGDDLGPVDMDDLRSEVEDLHIHFTLFRDRTSPPEDVLPSEEEVEELEEEVREDFSDDEVEELMAELDEEMEEEETS